MQIKHRWTQAVLFEDAGDNIRDTAIAAVKEKANLSGANLRGANLGGADLRGADLYEANLREANLYGVKIRKAIVFSGLYKYVVIPFISEDGEKFVKMGCYTRKVSEWIADFWNNPNEFPNDGSEKSNLRKFAFETAMKWFEIIDP